MPANRDITTTQISCHNCAGGLRNHSILKKHEYKDINEPAGASDIGEYQIVQCHGCDEIKFRKVSRHRDYNIPEEGDIIVSKIYHEHEHYSHRADKDLLSIASIGSIYGETVKAVSCGCRILAAGGLRACVEAICKDQRISGDNLYDKIEGLVNNGLLAKQQADYLHEERHLGNKALHDLTPPELDHLMLGLEIIESMLRTIYVLPLKADTLRGARTSP